MKPFSFIIMLSFSLCASVCCPEEDDFGNNIVIENDNLISIQNDENSFNLNENIVIETQVSNVQTSEAQGEFLLTDLFYDDSLDIAFLQHNMVLYKQTGFGTLSQITLTENALSSDNGAVEPNGQIITVRSFYDTNTDSFRSRFSINLQETGTFFLANTRFSVNDFSDIIISGGVFELGFVEILSSIENANSDGGYEFQVNE